MVFFMTIFILFVSILLSFSSNSFQFIFTNPTFSAFFTIFKISNYGVFWRELMSSTAMCFSSIFSRSSFSPENILGSGHFLKMVRIHTSSVSTKMVEFLIGRYLFSKHFIRYSVCHLSTKRFTSISTVPSSFKVSCPRPAIRTKFFAKWAFFINFFKESFFKCFSHNNYLATQQMCLSRGLACL